MTGHTPGPWTVYEDEEEGTLVVQYEVSSGYYLPILGEILSSSIASDDPFSDEDRANARLIAAAPDMLEALKAVIDNEHWMGLMSCMRLTMVRAAIAKAEGKEREEK